MNVAPAYVNPALAKPQVMSDITFREMREFIYQKTGIYFQDNKKYLLESRISKRLQMLRLDRFEAYLDFLKFGTGREDEKKYLFDAITINETYFFRNEPQFEVMEKTLIPEIIKAKPGGRGKLRIWSSASSSG